MNDPVLQDDSTGRPEAWGQSPPEDAPPQFGALDIVEAFTAMRHEWRGQTKEGRASSEQIQAAVARLELLEASLQNRAAPSSQEGAPGDKQLARLIAETDHQLTRAMAAFAALQCHQKQRDDADSTAIERRFAALNPVARWFARPLLAFLLEQRANRSDPAENAAIEGLQMVLTRLRQSMREQGIERIDVEGAAFDATIMNAIGATSSESCPAGHVAEQLSPCYRWRREILRYADVRVAK